MNCDIIISDCSVLSKDFKILEHRSVAIGDTRILAVRPAGEVEQLYEADEVEDLYSNMVQNNKILLKNISGRANCYIVNLYDSSKRQMNMIRNFCKKNIEIGRIYMTTPGENSDTYYKLIQDIRNKNMDILIMNVFTILGMSERELNMVIHLCRENNIIFLEI